ncbi:unnamed protein product [Ilex paraguariensis]|uniref:RRM domain-containing protein n=1 Tax=Ilex paraguariensis TaxID=185542 RepID=A0ABC8STJ0_9AQUA
MCSGHHLIEFLMVKWGLKCVKLLDGFSFMPSCKASGLSGNIQLAEIVLNDLHGSVIVLFNAARQFRVRRIMERNHRMGMVINDSTTDSIADYACEVEITDCEPLPDGRFYLQVFLEYADVESATKARTGLNGRKFGGNPVVAVFYPENKFSEGDYDG